MCILHNKTASVKRVLPLILGIISQELLYPRGCGLRLGYSPRGRKGSDMTERLFTLLLLGVVGTPKYIASPSEVWVAMLQEGGPLSGPETGFLSNTQK